MSRETTFLVSRDARCLNLIRSLAQVGWKYISKVTWSFTTFISPVLSLTTRFVTTGIMHLLYYSFVVFLDSAFLLRYATFSFSQSHGSTHNSPHRIVSQQYSCLHRTTFAALLLFTRFFHRQNIQTPSFSHQQPRYIISALTLSSCHSPWLLSSHSCLRIRSLQDPVQL